MGQILHSDVPFICFEIAANSVSYFEGSVKHIYFVAETKGTMESLELRPIEQSKIRCAKKLFNELSTSEVRYHDVTSYEDLLNVMKSIN